MTQNEITKAIEQLLSDVPTPSSATTSRQWIVDAVEVFMALRAGSARVERSPAGLLAKVQREAYALEAMPGEDDQRTAAVLREIETFITGQPAPTKLVARDVEPPVVKHLSCNCPPGQCLSGPPRGDPGCHYPHGRGGTSLDSAPKMDVPPNDPLRCEHRWRPAFGAKMGDGLKEARFCEGCARVEFAPYGVTSEVKMP